MRSQVLYRAAQVCGQHRWKLTAVAKAHLHCLRYRQLHDRQDGVNLVLLSVRDLDGAHLAADLRLL